MHFLLAIIVSGWKLKHVNTHLQLLYLSRDTDVKYTYVPYCVYKPILS